MKKIFIGSSLGILAVAIVIPTIVALNIPKFENQLQKDVVTWNSKLPEGYQIKLDNNCDFSSCTGRYNLVSNFEDSEKIEMYLDFSAQYNPLHFIFMDKDIPLSGNVTLVNKTFTNDYITTTVDIKDKYLLTFNGTVKRTGKMNINFEKNPLQVSIAEEDAPALIVFKDTEKSKGSFSFDKYTIKLDINTPNLLISSSALDETGLEFHDIKVSSQTDIERRTPDSELTTSGEILISHLADTSIDRILEAKNLFTTFKFSEGLTEFKHKTILKADEFSHASIGDLSYLIDYDISVPIASKQALIDFLQTIQSLDIETRQGSFYEILKNGFNLNFNNFNIVELTNNNSIKSNFKLSMDKAEDGKNFTDRANFEANIHSTGELANTALNMTGLNIAELINDEPLKDDSEIKIETSESPLEYKLKIVYENGAIQFNNKPADKIFSPIVNTSLLSLENLLKEGEENYKKYQAGDVSALSLEENNDDTLEGEEAPPEIGLEDDKSL